MVIAIIGILAAVINLIIYFIFGSLITGCFNKHRFSATLSVISGFFLYFTLFELVCIPCVVKIKPLHFLAHIWVGAIIAVVIISAVINHKKWLGLLGESVSFIKERPLFCLFCLVFISVETFIIVHCYQFTLDAAFYVGTANTSLTTDTINIYNPYTGMWQDHFEMRYFFANYAINDAVMSYITGLHPLIWTKTVMEIQVVILVNLVMYRMGRALFKGDLYKTGLFMFFAGFMSFFYSTIFTAQEFFVTRTYEGKTLLGSLVIPLVFMVYIKFLEDHRDPRYWWLLLLMSIGSLVLSNSASMLFPAALLIFMLPLFIIKKDGFILLKTGFLLLPGVLSLIMYILYVKGYYVIYTMPA
ncbi:MAG: hypothetical protein K5668_10880 [Lachnospiraceae bacterium]|nr:hypothetical protein [Lachnospiraceae bacterium]